MFIPFSPILIAGEESRRLLSVTLRFEKKVRRRLRNESINITFPVQCALISVLMEGLWLMARAVGLRCSMRNRSLRFAGDRLSVNGYR